MRIIACLFASLALMTHRAAAQVEIKQLPDKIRVEIAGELFTEYCFSGAEHPYFYPLLGPGGARMTRSWPMENAPGEEHDHPHHRSLWFAHGNLNGFDFWTESASHKTKKALGRIVHQKFLELKSGPEQGVIRDLVQWIDPEGKVLLNGEQTLIVFNGPANQRLFDFEVKLSALEQEVTFGDTKEGSFALRIAESMRLTLPGKKPGLGHLFNSAGQRDEKVWGQYADWVAATGPVNGRPVGIAIFAHPKNAKAPTRWHARDYGLLAANPFCEHEMDPTKAKGSGNYQLAAGQSLSLRYRIYLFEGDFNEAAIRERYQQYVAGK